MLIRNNSSINTNAPSSHTARLNLDADQQRGGRVTHISSIPRIHQTTHTECAAAFTMHAVRWECHSLNRIWFMNYNCLFAHRMQLNCIHVSIVWLRALSPCSGAIDGVIKWKLENKRLQCELWAIERVEWVRSAARHFHKMNIHQCRRHSKHRLVYVEINCSGLYKVPCCPPWSLHIDETTHACQFPTEIENEKPIGTAPAKNRK